MRISSWAKQWFLLDRTIPAKQRLFKHWHYGMLVFADGMKSVQERLLPERRPGVTINRRDLIAIPVPGANLLWRNLHVRDVRTIDGKP